MKIEQDKPIDCLYLAWLKEVAEYYDNDIDFQIKQLIWKEWHEIQERKENIERWKNESA